MHPVYSEGLLAKPGKPRSGEEYAAFIRDLKEKGQELTVTTEASYCSDTLKDGTEELEKIKQEDQVPGKDCIKTVKYWKSKRGNYRKAGNSKPRPGEIEVSLTEDEIEKL
jgi:hypothetical protein